MVRKSEILTEHAWIFSALSEKLVGRRWQERLALIDTRHGVHEVKELIIPEAEVEKLSPLGELSIGTNLNVVYVSDEDIKRRIIRLPKDTVNLSRISISGLKVGERFGRSVYRQAEEFFQKSQEADPELVRELFCYSRIEQMLVILPKLARQTDER